jgi:transcriptional regulator with XRE-family HTH domain
MEPLGDKLRLLRERKAWSQEDLAREIGVSLSTIQRWETKGSRPSRLARRELKRLFGLDVNPRRQ